MWEVLVQKLYLGVKNMCKKFREHPTVGLDLCRDNILTTPPNRAMDISREICTDSFYTVNGGLPRVPLTAVPYFWP